MRIFGLKGSDHLAAAVARSAGAGLAAHEERDFEDGEHKARPLVSVRGEDVYVIHSLGGGGSPNDRLVKLLFFLATCRENGAARLTAVLPYLTYARKDRQTKSRDPVTTRYLAQLLEAVGVDCVVVLEVHNFAAFQNAFRCRTVHLDTRELFRPAIRPNAPELPVVFMSPDGGGVKRVQLLKETFEHDTGEEAGFAFMEKRRSGGVVSGDLVAGDVDGRSAFIVDDMISTGGTILRAAHACRERGAKEVHAIATHGLFGHGSEALLSDPAIDRIMVTDSLASAVSAAAGQSAAKLQIVSCANLLGEAITRLHGNESISDLLGLQD
jgi:ribose-phosphate pyrophosphokinase